MIDPAHGYHRDGDGFLNLLGRLEKKTGGSTGAQGSKKALYSIPLKLLTLIVHEKNYHENFNEVNRDETFGAIWKWMQKILG